MTRLLLITLLLLSSSPAYAEWVLVHEVDNGMTVYVDPDTIRRKGNLVKMWSLLDFKTIQTVESDSFWSSKTQMEYDCAEERIRQLAYSWFSGNMGSGNTVHSSANEGKWESVTPKSIAQPLWKVACDKQ